LLLLVLIIASSIRSTFVDPLLQAEFNENGYVVVDIADPDKLQQLLDAYHQLYPDDEYGCFFSCHDSDFDRRLRSQALIRNIIEANAATLLNRYQFVSGAFVAKHPGNAGVVKPHIDHTFVDHQLYSAIAVWFPLTELTSDTGRLHVVPGSHIYTPICGSNLLRLYPHISISQMTEVKPKVGQAVCYDLQLIHASPANESTNPRIAANCVFTPTGAQLLHVTQREGRIYRYAVDLEFYTTRGGNESANQLALQRYPVLDSQPSAFDDDRREKFGSKAKRPDAIQRLINRGARFCNRWM